MRYQERIELPTSDLGDKIPSHYRRKRLGQNNSKKLSDLDCFVDLAWNVIGNR